MERLRDVDAALRAEYGLRRRMLIERAQVQSHALLLDFCAWLYSVVLLTLSC